MVKYSKYLITTLLLLSSFAMKAQLDKQTFSPMKRDSEITRVTLENHFKQYDKEKLLNNLNGSSTNYTQGVGFELKLEAPNASIFINNGIFHHTMDDKELMDTFYDKEMIALQKERLINCVTDFLGAFADYLPQIPSNENYIFSFEVKDKVKKDGHEQTSKKQPLRTYEMKLTLAQKDLSEIKSKSLKANEIRSKINVAYNKL